MPTRVKFFVTHWWGFIAILFFLTRDSLIVQHNDALSPNPRLFFEANANDDDNSAIYVVWNVEIAPGTPSLENALSNILECLNTLRKESDTLLIRSAELDRVAEVQACVLGSPTRRA